MTRPAEPLSHELSTQDGALDVAAVHAQHGDLIWRNLHRMGVPSADLSDAVQEVLMVVHRRLDSYDPSSRLSTWLYGICVRVASNQRRRIRLRREDPLDTTHPSDDPPDSRTPERLTAEQQAQKRLRQILDTLDPEKRATFVLFELEGLSCSAIAEEMGVPVGTVFSRLHAARQAFTQELARLNRIEGRTDNAQHRRMGT